MRKTLGAIIFVVGLLMVGYVERREKIATFDWAEQLTTPNGVDTPPPSMLAYFGGLGLAILVCVVGVKVWKSATKKND
ncbi:MAG: hypothetical protein O7D91_09455 [Planctomycetota bacterium]|nr:hypothetical protein [Planctomycetota bacterium]